MDEGVPPDPWLEAANLHATVAQLLSTVIHQVNNALQTIGGHAELLKTDPGVTETTRRRANTITGVTDRTAEMLASFQVFTRPSTGPSIQSLKDVATRALAFRHYGLGRARIQAVVQGSDRALASVEPRPLMQAVLNLILNAEQALTGGHEGRITIDVTQAGDRSVLSIEDNGPGLPAPQAEGHPLGALGQANRLGLGLRTAAGILARMGGTCEAVSVPGGGTKVVVSLPAAAQD